MYTSEANIAAKLGTALTDEQSAYFTDVLDAGIDAYINRITGTSFGVTLSGAVYVSGEGTGTLLIPTMHDITSVARMTDVNAEELIPVDDYTTFPRSSDNKYALRKQDGIWEDGFDNYKVTGEMGYKTIPADIVLIATELAVNDLHANINGYKSERVDQWSVTYGETSNALSDSSLVALADYKRLSRSF